MKYTLSILAMLLLSFPAQSQMTQRISGGDTLFTSDNVRFVVGEDIKLGTGTMPDGDFKFITPSRLAWSSITGNNAYKHVPAKFSGHLCTIKAIKQYGNKKHGYVNYLMLGAGQAMNWECDIENALKAGEIVVSNYSPISSSATPVMQKSSPADELMKYKKLLDAGAITQEEYATQKKKILNQ